MTRHEISDAVWAVMEPLMPTVSGRSRPWTDHRLAVEGMAWKYRTGAPWRDVPERFGKWNSIYKRFNRWAEDGTWEKLLAEVQKQADAAGKIDWVVSIDSTIARVHQHGATLSRDTGALSNHKNSRVEPPDHAIGRSRGGLTTKLHLVADGRGRPLGMMITGGNVNDTTMMTAVLEDIRVPRVGKGRPRTRPDRVLADKGYPSRANRAWLRERGIAATIPERDDQIAHRRKKPGRPIDFGDQQQERYKGRNVVERCFNRLKQWRGIAMRSDKLARNYRAAICLAATLIWIKTDLINTA
ncbi:IS5 family transposase [Microbacterium sp. NIBRBAC000506063]|uniref:IS5 family transposase n=3 Tax=Microbacterium sp. NIBRBAC000506063 TaxID=2734618 RepID=UPI001BB802DD|nr:IS5 family transposase [Microbacterium sp. NIBRBAC000506063]QTV79854.1 IS5 family transposase [Microbacterium sp. NIBRBAC000506063]QTV79996.1 IS5 family transposase [Microbacterium sp. NIBRBAC000506063]QTV80813.1 IS5 family transposase [Microbacterium sp. NIBRBAC000506063]